MAVPDVRELAGKSLRYRTSAEWFEVTGNQNDTCTDLWYFEIPGRAGTIVPWSDDMLALVVDGRPVIANDLMRQPWVTQERSQHGDDGCNAVFHVSHFKKAARFAKSWRRSTQTEEQRAASIERLKAYQWKKQG